MYIYHVTLSLQCKKVVIRSLSILSWYQSTRHSFSHNARKHLHLLAQLRAKRAPSRWGTTAAAPPNPTPVVSPITTPVAPQSFTLITPLASVSAYMSSRTIASTPASGTPDPWVLTQGLLFT
jgi:hypothetical protein